MILFRDLSCKKKGLILNDIYNTHPFKDRSFAYPDYDVCSAIASMKVLSMCMFDESGRDNSLNVYVQREVISSMVKR